MQEIINRIYDKGDYLYQGGALRFYPYDHSKAFSYWTDGEKVERLDPDGHAETITLEEFYNENS